MIQMFFFDRYLYNRNDFQENSKPVTSFSLYEQAEYYEREIFKNYGINILFEKEKRKNIFFYYFK